MDIEIESLRRKLKTAQYALSQTQSQMELHKIRTRQLVMAWKIRIYEADGKLKKQRQERDMELKEITSQLLFFEAQLKKEQSDIKVLLKEKDIIISQQRKKIKVLEKQNAELHLALREAKKLFPNLLRVSFSNEESKDSGISSGSYSNEQRSGDFSKGMRHHNSKISSYSTESLDKESEVMSHNSLSRESSINDDVFFVFPIEGNRNNSAKSDNSPNQTMMNHVNKIKSGILKESGMMIRSKSLPNCSDVNLNTEKGDSQKIDPNIKVKDKKHKLVKKQNHLRSKSGVESPSKTTRKQGSVSADPNMKLNGIPKNSHMAKSQPNLNRSFDGMFDYSQSENSLNTSTLSLDMNQTGKKNESTGERIKRAFLRPRDVKKKSNLRSRSNSLKENDKETSNKASPNKRYFSFAF